MDTLSISLKERTHNMGESSFSTRVLRQRGLMAMAGELRELGYYLPDARNVKTKHIEALVRYWKGKRLSDQTIRNRLVWVRKWAQSVGKPGLVPRSNDTFGLAPRAKGLTNRAKPLTPEMLAKVPDERVRLVLRLEAEFGLRREEALKMRPVIADRGPHLALKASWCKGGRSREIPIVRPEQRALVGEVLALVKDGSLIPPDMNYHQALKRYENITLKAGISRAHDFRHWYAQQRYLALAGWESPFAGGPTCDAMTAEQERRDYHVRMAISHELGHGRIDVTDTYLGRRWAASAKREAAA